MEWLCKYTKEKLEIFVEFYSALDSSLDPLIEQMNNFLYMVNIPWLREEDQKILEPIQLIQIKMAINSLKSNKTPDSDGLTGECYKKKFQQLLAPLLQRLFSECLGQNKTPRSWLEARIVVIPELDKESALLQDYQPIALLNLDYKILMTILANRLNEILGTYIHRDQAGFIKKKPDICRILINIIDRVRERGKPTVVFP